MAFEVVELVGYAFQFLLAVGLAVGEGEHFLVVGVDEVDQLRLVRALFGLALVLQLQVLIPQFLELALLGVDLCLELVLAGLVVLDQPIVELFVLLADLLNLLLFVILDLPDLTLQFVDLLLLLLGMLGPLLPQPQQLALALCLGFLQ